MASKVLCSILFFMGMLLWSLPGTARIKGIYITQPTLQNTTTIKYLIQRSKQTGINTFVIDLWRVTNSYKTNIQLVHKSRLKYIARIVVFPHGGTASEVKSVRYWNKKYQLVQQAIKLGASEIQLDYIRYTAKRHASIQNAKDIYRVIKWFHDRLQQQGIPLQIDVFGISTERDSLHIGQSIPLFAPVVDAMCPMVYPSHYAHIRHSYNPYSTVYAALAALKRRFNGKVPFRIYPYIEVSNYRYRLGGMAKVKYIYEQIRAVDDSNVDGWFFWSPNNRYNALFTALQIYKVK